MLHVPFERSFMLNKMFCVLLIGFISSEEITFYDNKTRMNIINGYQNGLKDTKKEIEGFNGKTDSLEKDKAELKQKYEKIKAEMENKTELQLCPPNSYVDISLSHVDYPHEVYNPFKELSKGTPQFKEFPKMPNFEGLLVKYPHPSIYFRTNDPYVIMEGFAFEAAPSSSCQMKEFNLTVLKDNETQFSKNFTRTSTVTPFRVSIPSPVQFDTLIFDEIDTFGNKTTLCFPAFAVCETIDFQPQKRLRHQFID